MRQAGWFVLALLAVFAISARGDIQLGSTYDQLVAELGYGDSTTRIGANVEIRSYRNGTRVRLEKGVVTEITRRGQIGIIRVLPTKSATALLLDQKLAGNDPGLRDRSDHQQTVKQGGQTQVQIVHDDERGEVLKFDGQDAYLRVVKPTEMDSERGLTLCAWVRPDGLAQQLPLLEWEKNGAHFWLNVKDSKWNDKPAGVNWCIQGEGIANVVSTTNPPAGLWTHVAVSFNPQKHTGAVFINGERVIEKDVPDGTPRAEGDLIVGARPGMSVDARFKGLLDDVRVILRPMNEEEIRQIMGPAPRRVVENDPVKTEVTEVPVLPPAVSTRTSISTRPALPANNGRNPPAASAPEKAANSPPSIDAPRALAVITGVLAHIEQIGMALVLLLSVIAVLGYVFSCYCYKLICNKAGKPPGALVWVPLVQFIPLLRVAQMADWKLILLLIPFVNLVVMIMLWARICAALHKSPWLAASLLVPFVNLLLIPYLAFSRFARDPSIATRKA